MQKYCFYIVLTRTSTVISRLIQFFKKDMYTHAAISLDKELNSMYGFGRKVAHNPVIGGFNQERIDKGLYKFQKTLPGVIMEVEVSKEQYERTKSLLGHFISNRNLYKYNYIGLFHSLFHKEVCYENRFLCSEFVYYILKESGVADLNIPRNLVRPQHLLHIPSKIIFQGNLKEVKSSANTSTKGKLSKLSEPWGRAQLTFAAFSSKMNF